MKRFLTAVFVLSLLALAVLFPMWLMELRAEKASLPEAMSAPSPTPVPTAIPAPTPPPTPEPTEDPALLYERAREKLFRRELKAAAELLRPLGDYADSARWLRYCERRADDPPLTSSLLRTVFYRPKHDRGAVYSTKDALVYVPDEINSETAFVFYYPGDSVSGEIPLDKSSAVDYTANFAPNAVCYFSFYSSSRDPEQKNRSSWQTAERLMQECGIIPHELYIVGASNGFYTAMELALMLVTEEELRPRCVMSWDAGEDWARTDRQLSPEELAALAEAGVRIELFEQRQFDPGREVIQRMVRAGLAVDLIECVDGDHEAIPAYAFRLGAISWSMGDCPLNEEMYLLTPVELVSEESDSGGST